MMNFAAVLTIAAGTVGVVQADHGSYAGSFFGSMGSFMDDMDEPTAMPTAAPYGCQDSPFFASTCDETAMIMQSYKISACSDLFKMEIFPADLEAALSVLCPGTCQDYYPAGCACNEDYFTCTGQMLTECIDNPLPMNSNPANLQFDAKGTPICPIFKSMLSDASPMCSDVVAGFAANYKFNNDWFVTNTEMLYSMCPVTCGSCPGSEFEIPAGFGTPVTVTGSFSIPGMTADDVTQETITGLEKIIAEEVGVDVSAVTVTVSDATRRSLLETTGVIFEYVVDVPFASLVEDAISTLGDTDSLGDAITSYVESDEYQGGFGTFSGINIVSAGEISQPPTLAPTATPAPPTPAPPTPVPPTPAPPTPVPPTPVPPTSSPIPAEKVPSPTASPTEEDDTPGSASRTPSFVFLTSMVSFALAYGLTFQ